MHSGEQLLEHPGHSARCLPQTFSIWVFAKGGQQLAHGSLGPLDIDG
jgi:hypothetical protein